MLEIENKVLLSKRSVKQNPNLFSTDTKRPISPSSDNKNFIQVFADAFGGFVNVVLNVDNGGKTAASGT